MRNGPEFNLVVIFMVMNLSGKLRVMRVITSLLRQVVRLMYSKYQSAVKSDKKPLGQLSLPGIGWRPELDVDSCHSLLCAIKAHVLLVGTCVHIATKTILEIPASRDLLCDHEI